MKKKDRNRKNGRQIDRTCTIQNDKPKDRTINRSNKRLTE